MKNFHRIEYCYNFLLFFQKWTDQISKQRQGPACIFSLENCAEIPDEEKLGHSAGNCKACAKIKESVKENTTAL